MGPRALHGAITLLLWTLVGIAKIVALLLLIDMQWLTGAAALAVTVLLVAVALAWRRTA